MSDNKALWNRAFTTDPRAVKPITGKQYKGNSPKPYWLIERATDEFGPIGIGWGVTVKSERFERLSDMDVLHVAVVSVWYVLDGKRSETFDQMGGTKAAYKTAKGDILIDEDAGKKSVTDGMVKCLSMLGFAGDIFSGMWDDSKYVQWAGEEWDRRYAEASAPPEPQRMSESTLADWQTIIQGAIDSADLEAKVAEAYAAAEALKDGDAYRAIRATYRKHPAAMTTKKVTA
jgi:hypothetical protein